MTKRKPKSRLSPRIAELRACAAAYRKANHAAKAAAVNAAAKSAIRQALTAALLESYWDEGNRHV